MSDISGTGYGSSHDWKRKYTTEYKVTIYECGNCGADFRHAYDVTPEIFKALEESSVPEHCDEGEGR